MKTFQKIATLVVAVLLLATGYGLFRTHTSAAAIGDLSSGRTQAALEVDQSSLWTARWLAQMPTSAGERQVAEDALQLADKEMDLAFATALREAELHPPALSLEAKKIEARIQKSESAVTVDQAKVAQLTAQAKTANGKKKDELDAELNLAKAQAELDQDEVDDGKEDLLRAGGDQQARIQAITQEHEAASQISDNTHVIVTPPNDKRGLIHRFQEWSAMHSKQMQLWQAKAQAEADAAKFSAAHSALDAKIDSQSGASAAPASPTSGSTSSTEDSSAMLQLTKRRSQDQKALSTFDKRVEDQTQLAGVYGKWIGIVASEQRIVLNHALRGIAIILVIALIGLFFDGWIESLLGKMSMDRRQVETLRTVTRVSVQIVGVLFILLVILGPPTQLGTFLGLAGAGLTVALKDFIVSFLGWFVLMGKNGIRLGDWVEINGVTGEVVELGMFHTVLLETGNWTDSGHPTGRRVTFTNSFAIEGHYFNFSTTGQWLWDELQVVLPIGLDPYPIVDSIQKKVKEATSESAQQAEQEWKTAAHSRNPSVLSAVPAINVKPVIGGVEISVRYVARANERYQLRAKLYQVAVDLLGKQNLTYVGPPVVAVPAGDTAKPEQ
ncbi:MAG TPA: mechanosensitive ion channel domain-containing protein [Terriglobales bacterium]|jgi:small-conductance mechanosensitive channel|nr:mechanosensitive ion channel domain-containing protein [Terriglobales bacterium]